MAELDLQARSSASKTLFVRKVRRA